MELEEGRLQWSDCSMTAGLVCASKCARDPDTTRHLLVSASHSAPVSEHVRRSHKDLASPPPRQPPRASVSNTATRIRDRDLSRVQRLPSRERALS